MNSVEPVPESRASTSTVLLDCTPEVKKKFNFMTLFGLPPDPVIYGRIMEEDGLPAKNLHQFLTNTGLQEEQIISILEIVPRTMQRRMEAGRLTPEESYELFRVAQAFVVMIDVLGNARRALVWFKTPQEDLDNHTPLEKCRTESGRNIVNDEVVRIMFDVY
jgi:putative toxin-antitoxin system antitoxin component (TIGR02293 family)